MQAPIEAIENEANPVNRDIELTRMRLELVRLQRELQLQRTGEPRGFDFTLFEEATHKFTGDDTYDVKKWFVDLERAFALYNCGEADKLIAVQQTVDGTAKLVLRSKQILTYEQFKRTLIEEFDRGLSVFEVHQQLRTRKLNRNESIRHYVAAMEEIASSAEIPEFELVNRIVEGIQDRSLDGMVLYSARTMRDLKLALKWYEKKRIERMLMRIQSGNGEAAAKQGQTLSEPKPLADMSKKRCYNCLIYGHFQSKCDKPKAPPACFLCKEVGQLICPLKGQVQQRQMQQVAAPTIMSAAKSTAPNTDAQSTGRQLIHSAMLRIVNRQLATPCKGVSRI